MVAGRVGEIMTAVYMVEGNNDGLEMVCFDIVRCPIAGAAMAASGCVRAVRRSLR